MLPETQSLLDMAREMYATIKVAHQKNCIQERYLQRFYLVEKSVGETLANTQKQIKAHECLLRTLEDIIKEEEAKCAPSASE